MHHGIPRTRRIHPRAYGAFCARSGGIELVRIYRRQSHLAAGLFAQSKIKQGDLILVKGSQGARMEKVVKELMAEPLLAKDLLVRQGEEWQS